MVLTVWASISARAEGPSDSSGQVPKKLRVISYNVQFLPGIARLFNARGNDDYRPRRLGQVLAEYDIIGLNEVFELAPRKVLLEEIHRAWGDSFFVYETPEPGPTVGRYNAGLAVVSRYPMVARHHKAYSAASSKKEFGVFADEFAAKGCLHARIEIPDANRPFAVDILTTHLDSKLASVREIQRQEMSAFAIEHSSPENPLLFMGDFNTRGPYRPDDKPGPEYQGLLDHLRQARGNLTDAWLRAGQGPAGTSEQLEADGGTRIDYIFFAPPAQGPGPISLRSVKVERFLDPKVTSLSDHSAVVAEFDIPAP
jgi:endonuclease/exonuclease/phosphatase family metal-dependent hydrolase